MCSLSDYSDEDEECMVFEEEQSHRTLSKIFQSQQGNNPSSSSSFENQEQRPSSRSSQGLVSSVLTGLSNTISHYFTGSTSSTDMSSNQREKKDYKFFQSKNSKKVKDEQEQQEVIVQEIRRASSSRALISKNESQPRYPGSNSMTPIPSYSGVNMNHTPTLSDPSSSRMVRCTKCGTLRASNSRICTKCKTVHNQPIQRWSAVKSPPRSLPMKSREDTPLPKGKRKITATFPNPSSVIQNEVDDSSIESESDVAVFEPQTEGRSFSPLVQHGRQVQVVDDSEESQDDKPHSRKPLPHPAKNGMNPLLPDLPNMSGLSENSFTTNHSKRTAKKAEASTSQAIEDPCYLVAAEVVFGNVICLANDMILMDDQIKFNLLAIKDKDSLGVKNRINIGIPYVEVDKLMYSTDNYHNVLLCFQLTDEPAAAIINALRIPEPLKEHLTMNPNASQPNIKFVFIFAKKDPKSKLVKTIESLHGKIAEVKPSKYSQLVVYFQAAKTSYARFLRFFRTGMEIPKEVGKNSVPVEVTSTLTQVEKAKADQLKQLTSINALKRDHYLASKLQEQEFALSGPSRSTRSSVVAKPKQSPVFTIDLVDDEEEPKPSTSSQSSQEKASKHLKTEDNLLFSYPPDDNHPVTIYESDRKCLKPLEFLNDNIVDFYLK